MKITTVFFDLGNTLICNTRLNNESIKQACYAMATQFLQFPYPLTIENLANKHHENLKDYYILREDDYIEHSADLIFQHTMESLGFPQIPPEHIAIAMKSFYDATQKNWNLIPGVPAMLRRLRKEGRKIGLISNASYANDVHQLIQTHGLAQFLDSVTISAEAGYRKPRTEIFEIALCSLSSMPQQSVMIGDSYMADIFGGNQKGLKTIWCTRYANQSLLSLPLCQPDAQTDDVAAVPAILQQWENESAKP